MLGDLVGRRRAAELARQVLDRVVDLHHALLHAARHVHGPAVVAEVALELAEHRRHRVGGERRLARGVEAVDRLDQPERRDLDQIVERLVGAPVAARHPAREREQARDELLARGLVAVAVVAEQQPPVLLRPRDAAVLGRRHRAAGVAPRRRDVSGGFIGRRGGLRSGFQALPTDRRRDGARHLKQRVTRAFPVRALTLPGTGRRRIAPARAARRRVALRRRRRRSGAGPRAAPSANSSTSLAQNAGRSSGLREVTRPSSTWTSSSTQVAPALRRSVRSDGHEVSVRPRDDVGLDERPRAVADHARPAWPARRTRARRRPHPRRRAGSRGWRRRPAARARRSARASASATVWSTGNVSALSRWLKAWTWPASSEISSGVPPASSHRLPRLGQLHLLDALGGEERDRLAIELRVPCGSFRPGPLGRGLPRLAGSQTSSRGGRLRRGQAGVAAPAWST